MLGTRESTVRLPLPTGHRVAGVVTLDGQPVRLGASADGRPLLELDGPAAGLLRYTTAPDADPPRAPPPSRAFTLPPDLDRQVQQLRVLPAGRRVAALRDLVRQRVRYDHTDATVRRHREALARGDGFIARTLAAGAGDCDVQNGLLTALLQAADVRARLALGYLGDRERCSPGCTPGSSTWARATAGRWWTPAPGPPPTRNRIPPSRRRRSWSCCRSERRRG